AHHDLVTALCDAGPCLPVRFGTWLSSEEAARRSVVAGADAFSAAVERLSGRQEIAVTLLWPASEVQAGRGHRVGAPTGRAFLDGKRAIQAVSDERRMVAEGLAVRLSEALAAEQEDVRHETCPSAEVALSLSVLAPRGEARALKARATTVVAGLPGVRGVVSGPWPPYSFTAVVGTPGGDDGSG
ncbi:MAG: GvpL/GvpF family gas vesicle protein, partial [Actinobacteria bacterium]|nr:GvpL/GvpF family gas vesicle protein [Actinomycetota bacterium]